MRFLLFCSFICIFQSLFGSQNVSWQELAREDVLKMYDALKDNHPGYIYDEGFKAQLQQGFEAAICKVSQVKSYEGLYFLLAEFATRFQDNHLRIEETYQHKTCKNPEALFAHFELVRPSKEMIGKWKYEETAPFRWPGFVVKRNGKGEMVIFKGFDNIGSKIVAIDEIPTELFLTKFIYPFHGGITSLEASKIKVSSLALIDFGNPFYPVPFSCIIEDAQGVQKELILNWEERTVDQLLKDLQKQNQRKLILKKLSDDILWVSIPSFSILGEAISQYNQIIFDVARYKDKKYIVIDLRGNKGGNSEWGRKLLLALSADLPNIYAEDYGIKWRVSPEILSHVKKSTSRIDARLGDESQIYREFYITAELMEGRIQKNDYSLLDQPVIRMVQDSLHNFGPSFEKIVLLTDASCGSATLNFLDHALHLPNVIHIGQETNADSIYHDIMLVSLPSKLFNITIPMKVWEKSPRGNNQPYTPSMTFAGDIENDQEVEDWVRTILKNKEM